MVVSGTQLLGALPKSIAVSEVALVVPCYNEAQRLEDVKLLSLVDGFPGVSLVLVNDGSKDATEARLSALSMARPRCIESIRLPENRGKAEAVRQGLRHALNGPAQVVGYFDADLSTPITEIARLIAAVRESDVAVVMGSRVSRLGSVIERSSFRHYVGRMFASAASLVLQAKVYDTQCGAKLFRRTPALQSALTEPFLSRWAFDVELLGRLLTGTRSVPGLDVAAFLEVPLLEWSEVAGSKLSVQAMARTLSDLIKIGFDLERRRRLRAQTRP